jgi:hypothetical protein
MSSYKTRERSYKMKRQKQTKRMRSSEPKLRGRRKWQINVFKANFSVIKLKKQKNSWLRTTW